ncbi:putative Glycogen recognition site of AMP-activated protein kinase [Blattamonas nauphoetae]|uniref:Glycogen recognition site of AMP-activated protein kinase n=1 Tax=Blattamonas nauphoetae TaxID=2049346 RepID=A0ABQ9Y3X7_9EUKA|nr:putative Glycogen recognition site of AMP-activated protein kinase [Blattamonas nauphoetae]
MPQIWFLQQNRTNYAVGFDQKTSQFLENAHQNRHNPAYVIPYITCLEYPTLSDPQALMSNSRRELDYSINFDSMSLVQRLDPSIVHKLIRWDSTQPMSDGGVNRAYRFEWPYEGNLVYLRGSFDAWSSSIPLQKKAGTNIKEVVLLLPADKAFSYKFIVDGTWVHREELPFAYDENGNVNNIIAPHESNVTDNQT